MRAAEKARAARFDMMLQAMQQDDSFGVGRVIAGLRFLYTEG